MVAMSVLLTGFTPYLDSRLSADAIFGAVSSMLVPFRRLQCLQVTPAHRKRLAGRWDSSGALLSGGTAAEPVRLPPARMVGGVRRRVEGRSGGPRRPAHGLLLRAARARAGGERGPTSTTRRSRLPYQDNLSALIHEPSFKQAAGEAVFSKARVINTLGNRAVHSHRAVPEADALAAVRELFHVAYWFARTYGRATRAGAGARLRSGGAAQTRGDRAADGGTTAHARGRAPGARREARGAARRQERARRGAEAPARRGGGGEAGRRRAAGHARRLLRSRDPRLLHRPAAQGSRLAARPGARPRVRGQRDAQRRGQGLRGLRPLGRRRQAARARRGQAHAARRACRPAAGQALRRLPGARVRAAAGHLLLQRLRALDLGRRDAIRRARCRASTRRRSWSC